MPLATLVLEHRESHPPRSPFRDARSFATPSLTRTDTMDIFDFPPLAALLDGAYSTLVGLAALLEPLTGASAAALAIVIVTLLVRSLLIPVGISQARAEQSRARLAPRLNELQRRHRNNPERLRTETLELYRRENTSPFAGMLPLLAQAPVIGILYTLFIRPEIAGHVNELLTNELFGVPLGSSLVGAAFNGAAFNGAATLQTLLVFGALVVVMIVVAELTRRMLPPPTSDPDSPLASPGMRHMMNALHYLTAVLALFVPLAAGIYLTVTVAWTLMQRVLLRRRYPLPEAVAPR